MQWKLKTHSGREGVGIPCCINTRPDLFFPAGSATKEQVAIRFDHDVLTAFRTAGPGWQTRMNDALRDWLKTHSTA